MAGGSDWACRGALSNTALSYSPPDGRSRLCYSPLAGRIYPPSLSLRSLAEFADILAAGGAMDDSFLVLPSLGKWRRPGLFFITCWAFLGRPRRLDPDQDLLGRLCT